MEAWSAGKLCPLCGPLLYPDWPRCTCSLVGCTLIVLWFDVCSQQHHSCTTFNRPLRNKIILHATSYTCWNLSESSQPCNLIDLISTPQLRVESNIHTSSVFTHLPLVLSRHPRTTPSLWHPKLQPPNSNLKTRTHQTQHRYQSQSEINLRY